MSVGSEVWGERWAAGWEETNLFGSLSALDYHIFWMLMPVGCVLYFMYYHLIRVKDSGNKKELPFEVRNNKSDLYTLVLVSLSIASWHQYFPATNPHHLYWAAAPMFGLAVCFLWKTLRKAIPNTIICSVAFLFSFSLFTTDIDARVERGMDKLNGDYKVIESGYLKGVKYTSNEEYNDYEGFFSQISEIQQEHPDIRFLNLSKDALFAIPFDNMINMHVNWGDVLYDDYSKRVDEIIAVHKPVLITDDENIPDGYDVAGEYKFIGAAAGEPIRILMPSAD
jgi:hypothetical protein